MKATIAAAATVAVIRLMSVDFMVVSLRRLEQRIGIRCERSFDRREVIDDHASAGFDDPNDVGWIGDSGLGIGIDKMLHVSLRFACARRACVYCNIVYYTCKHS